MGITNLTILSAQAATIKERKPYAYTDRVWPPRTINLVGLWSKHSYIGPLSFCIPEANPGNVIPICFVRYLDPQYYPLCWMEPRDLWEIIATQGLDLLGERNMNSLAKDATLIFLQVVLGISVFDCVDVDVVVALPDDC